MVDRLVHGVVDPLPGLHVDLLPGLHVNRRVGLVGVGRLCAWPCVESQALAASRARRTSTLARCRRYSGEAFRSVGGSVPSAASSAASLIDAPWASACSTAVARNGVPPMLTRPMPEP